MAFELKPSRMSVEVTLSGSGDTLVVYYAMPTNAQRLARHNELIRRDGKSKKTVISPFTFPTSVKFGKLVASGFEPGVLTVDGKIISADPAAENHCPEWKKLLEEICPDVFVVVDGVAFRAAKAAGDDDGVEYGDAQDFASDPSEPSTSTSQGAGA